jgi:hypothetical protein
VSWFFGYPVLSRKVRQDSVQRNFCALPGATIPIFDDALWRSTAHDNNVGDAENLGIGKLHTG